MTVKVDGKAMPPVQLDGYRYNTFSSVDAGGKVKILGTTVEIMPNRMTRVVANIFMQIFTNSRGGGDY